MKTLTNFYFVPFNKVIPEFLKYAAYLLFFFLTSCNSKNNKLTYTNKTPIDSLILIIDQEKKIGFEITAEKIHDMLFFNNDTAGANIILEYIQNRAVKEGKKSAFAVTELIKGYKSLWANNSEKALLNAFNAQKLITEQNTNIQFNIYNLIGNAYYYQNKIETAKSYFLKGYNLAVIENDSVQIKVFANNLGSLFNNQGQLVLSEYYFNNALKISASNNQIIDTVLVSNIYGIMINEKRFDDAKKFITNYPLLDLQKPRSSYKITILLNTIYMEQSLKNWDLSRTLLNLLSIKKIPDYQKTDYLACYATQLLNDNPSLVFSYLKHHIDLIKEDFPYSITQLGEVLSYCISKNEIILSLEEINELEKTYVFDGTNLRDESSVKFIKSLLFSNKNDFKNAQIESMHSLELTSKYNATKDSMRTSGITSKLKLEELFSNIAIAKNEIKENEKKKNSY